MTKKHKYSGVLATPIYPNPILNALVGSKADKQQIAASLMAQRNLRIEALAEDCGVDLRKHNAWYDIALVLAGRHIPGFSIADTPPHAKRDARQQRKLEIWIAMHRLIDHKRLSIRSAATVVARKRRKGETADALDRIYRRIEGPQD